MINEVVGPDQVLMLDCGSAETAAKWKAIIEKGYAAAEPEKKKGIMGKLSSGVMGRSKTGAVAPSEASSGPGVVNP